MAHLWAKAVCLKTNPDYSFTLYKISVVSQYFSFFSLDSITWSSIANNAAIQDVLQARPETVAICDNNKRLTSPLPNAVTLNELPEGAATTPNSHKDKVIHKGQEKKEKRGDGMDLESDSKSASSTTSGSDEDADDSSTLEDM